MTKKEIRKKILSLRDGIDVANREKGRILLTERIVGHQWFYLSDTILCFASYGSEIDTDLIIEEALRQKKKVCLPRIDGENMNFYIVSSMEEVENGYKGILEPKQECLRFQPKEAIPEKTLMIMPGVAFDIYGNRLGYGKGFYDRFLSENDHLSIRTIGVGFRCQIVEELPTDENDRKPYQVICV